MARTGASFGWAAIVEKCFAGNMRIAAGAPKVIVANTNATGAAPVGALWYNANNSKAWKNNAAAGNWVEITAD